MQLFCADMNVFIIQIIGVVRVQHPTDFKLFTKIKYYDKIMFEERALAPSECLIIEVS